MYTPEQREKLRTHINQIIDVIGTVVAHPATDAPCRIEVEIDDVDYLPHFRFCKTNELMPNYPSDDNTINDDDDDDGVYSNVNVDPHTNENDAIPELIESQPVQNGGVTGVTAEDDVDYGSDDQHDDPDTHRNNYCDVETDADDDGHESYSYYSSGSESESDTNVLIANAGIQSESPEPEPEPELEPEPEPEPEPTGPIFVDYTNGSYIYRTSDDRYIKLSGDKNRSKTITELDKVAQLMFIKTYGKDYEDNTRFIDGQVRYKTGYHKN